MQTVFVVAPASDIREKTKHELESKGYKVMCGAVAVAAPTVKQPSLYSITSSLLAMSQCDFALFCSGWMKNLRCREQHEMAFNHNVKILYQEDLT